MAYGEFQAAPFFVEAGAVVECPWCQKRLRLREDEFNTELDCPQCGGGFEVRVRSRHVIPIQCPNCLLRMDIAVRMAGKQTQYLSPSCRFGPIDVPDSPIAVRRLGRDGYRTGGWAAGNRLRW